MPYQRSYTRRTTSVRRRSSTPGFRGGARLIWTYETMAQSLTGAAPTKFVLSTTLLTQEGLSDTRGITFMGARYSLSAVPLVAPAAGTRDELFCGILCVNENPTAAQLDPSSIAARSRLDWAWLESWHQPFIAAPVISSLTVDGTRCGVIRSKRLIRQQGDQVVLMMGSQNAAQNWHLDGHISCLWKVR